MLGSRRPSSVLLSLLLVSAVLVLMCSMVGAATHWRPHARLPLEPMATGFRDLQGLAWGPDQALYATDREAGVVYRLEPTAAGAARVTVRQAGLNRPVGLAWGTDDALLVVEEGGARDPFGGRVLRLNGTPAPVWTGLKHPAWIAAAPDGTLYLTADGMREPGGRDGWGVGGAAALLLRRAPGATRGEVVATDLEEPGGLVVEPDGRLLLSVERLRHQGERRGPTLVRIDPTKPLGDRTRLDVVLGSGFLHPAGLAVDGVGGILLGAQEYAWLREERPDWREAFDLLRGALLRLRPGGRVAALVAGLQEIRAMTVDEQGTLYLATDETVYRMQPPAPPTLEPIPPFTTQTTLPVRGVAQPGAAITILGVGAPVEAQADAETGAFETQLPLAPNAEQAGRVYAISLAGEGLPSTPARFTVVADTRPPVVRVTAPSGGTLVRGAVGVAAVASDPLEPGEAKSGIATLQVRTGGQLLAQGSNPTPESDRPFTLTATWDTTLTPDGSVPLTATGQDRAGNTARDAITVTVDNTPPTVTLSGLPADGVLRGPVEVTVTASDATAGVATVALALDGIVRESGPGPVLRYTLAPQGLTGPHTLTATATDQAGNQAAVTRGFTVQGLTLQITAPTSGATLSSERVLVAGTVTGAPEVGVVVNGVGAYMQGAAFTAVVPVTPGATTLAAVAKTPTGLTAEARVDVVVSAPSDEPMRLAVSASGGPAPLTVFFAVSGVMLPSGSSPTGSSPGIECPPLCSDDPGGGQSPSGPTFEVDIDGNGTLDYVGPDLGAQAFTYTTPGLYFPSVRVADADGVPHLATALVEVYDGAAVTAALRGKWDGMRGALQRGDVEEAVGIFAESSRESYRQIFTALAGVGALPQLAQDLAGVRLVKLGNKYAEYELRATRNGGEYSYYVLFTIDADGLWRLWAF